MRAVVTGTPISHGGRADLVGLLKFLQVPHIPQGQLKPAGLVFACVLSKVHRVCIRLIKVMLGDSFPDPDRKAPCCP
jgi:hypothetical protein